jgi:hypothetical protein
MMDLLSGLRSMGAGDADDDDEPPRPQPRNRAEPPRPHGPQKHGSTFRKY